MYKDIIPKVRNSGHKAFSMLVASASILTTFGNTVVPIYAEDSSTDSSELTATMSGSTLNNQVNTIRTTTINEVCEGEQTLSGTDAEVFSKVVPESDGDIVCVRSDGFRTEVTGTSDVKNYHWVAWYKENVDDEIDTTNDLGNYRGFNASKVTQWSSHSDEIKALNGGAFPEVKDYTYPVDTKESKLDFWGDIAGYYSVLGDPQYKNIHLTAYQQFSYETMHMEEYIEYDSDGDDSGVSGTSEPELGVGSDSSSHTCKKNQKWSKKKQRCVKKGEPQTSDPIDHEAQEQWQPANGTGTYYSQSACEYAVGKRTCTKVNTQNVSYEEKSWSGNGKKLSKDLKIVKATVSALAKVGDKNVTKLVNDYKDYQKNGFMMYLDEGEVDPTLLGKIVKSDTQSGVVLGSGTDELGSYTMYADITYSWETQEVKVAEADVAQSAYATELGTMPRLALIAGSGSTYEISGNKTTFWKTTPRYWTDGGKITVKNDSTLTYHFESEDEAGSGKNNVNLYATLSQTDKLYSLIHGYPNITDTNIDTIPNPGYPKNADETCVEVGDDAVCSKKQTPLIHTEISLDDDNPQELEEADKSVHLTKSQETQDEIKSSKNSSSSDDK